MQEIEVTEGTSPTTPSGEPAPQTAKESAPAKRTKCFLLRRRAPDLPLKLVRLPLDDLDISGARPVTSTAQGWPADVDYVDAIAAANIPIVRDKTESGRYLVVCNSQTVAWMRSLDPFVIGRPAIINCLMIVGNETEAVQKSARPQNPAGLTDKAWRVIDQWISDFALGRLRPDVAADAALILKKSPLGPAKSFSLRERMKALIRP